MLISVSNQFVIILLSIFFKHYNKIVFRISIIALFLFNSLRKISVITQGTFMIALDQNKPRRIQVLLVSEKTSPKKFVTNAIKIQQLLTERHKIRYFNSKVHIKNSRHRTKVQCEHNTYSNSVITNTLKN